MPGALFGDVVDQLYRDDASARGTLEITGERIGPARLTAPLTVVVDPRSGACGRHGVRHLCQGGPVAAPGAQDIRAAHDLAVRLAREAGALRDRRASRHHRHTVKAHATISCRTSTSPARP